MCGRALPTLLLGALLASSVISQSCPPRLKSPVPSMLRCGGKVVPKRTGSQIGSFADGSLSDCAETCNAQQSCMSLTYDADPGLCTLYRRSRQKMGLQKSTDGTQFYVRHPSERLHLNRLSCFSTDQSCLDRILDASPPQIPYLRTST